jgi:hypothetical protein
MQSNIITAALVALAVVVTGVVIKPDVTVVVPEPTLIQQDLGASPGGQFYGPVAMHKGLLQTAYVSTSSAGTLTQAQLLEKSSLLYTGAAATLTLPASTTMGALLPGTGARRSILVVNSGTGTLTLAGGTGTLLTSASTTLTLFANTAAVLELVRKPNTDIGARLIGN